MHATCMHALKMVTDVFQTEWKVNKELFINGWSQVCKMKLVGQFVFSTSEEKSVYLSIPLEIVCRNVQVFLKTL